MFALNYKNFIDFVLYRNDICDGIQYKIYEKYKKIS